MILYSFIIPSFNEAQNLPILCDRLIKVLKKNKKLEVLLINNGSTDNTTEILYKQKINKYKNFRILNLKKNIGYGHGILSGLKIAKGQILIWFHADLQADPLDIFTALIKNQKKIFSNKFILKGKRTNRGFFDNFFTFFMSTFVNFIFKTSIRDINAQPKIFNKQILKKFKNPPNDFSLDLYFLLIAYFNNYKIIEYPIYCGKRYSGNAKGGGSLIGKVKLTIRSIKFIIDLKNKWK